MFEVVDEIFNTFVDIGLTELNLTDVFRKDYEEHKEDSTWHNRGFCSFIHSKLEKSCPRNMMEQMVNKIVTYFRNMLGASQGQRCPSWYTCPLCNTIGSHWLVRCEVSGGQFANVTPGDMEESYLRDDLEKLGSMRGENCQSIYSSLAAVKQFIIRTIGPEVLAHGGSDGQTRLLGEVVQKLLSLAKLSHFKLKEEFDKSSKSGFKRSLKRKLVIYEKNLPHGVKLLVLLNWISQYFGQYPKIRF